MECRRLQKTLGSGQDYTNFASLKGQSPPCGSRCQAKSTKDKNYIKSILKEVHFALGQGFFVKGDSFLVDFVWSCTFIVIDIECARMMERYLLYLLCWIRTFDFIFIYIHTFIVIQCCRITVVSVISYFPCRCSLTTSGLPCLMTSLRTNPSKALCLSQYPIFYLVKLVKPCTTL